MYFKIGIISVLMFASVCNARLRTIAVIDTGYSGSTASICKFGSYDFVKGQSGVAKDVVGHGTQVSDTVAKANKDYCLYVMRVFDSKQSFNAPISDAIFRAIALKADIINMSLEGHVWDDLEFAAINIALAHGIKVIVASGNDSQNLDKNCNIYPACYKIPGMAVVGTFQKDTKGNYGSVVTHQEAWCSEGICGTSLSTAIVTNKILKELK